MSETDPFDPEREIRKATRRHRILALTLGLPLAAVLVVPWRRYRDWVFLWDLPTETVLPMVAAGLAGLLFVGAAFVKAERRRSALAVAGVAAGASGLWLLGAIPVSSSELQRVGLFATRAWVLLAMFTAGAEMAMHRRPESRTLSVAAFLGWLGLLGFFFFLPIGREFVLEESTAAQLVEKLDHPYRRVTVVAPVFAWFAFVALFGLLQTMRRVGADRPLAAARRFRTSWLAWLLYPVPILAFSLFGAYLTTTLGDEDDLTNVFLTGALFYGCSLGGAIGIRSLFLSREGEGAVPIPKRALVAVGAALAIGLSVVGLYRLFASAGDEQAMEELGWEVAEAVGQAIRGEPFDRRFLGGYSELDLRNAEGAVALPANAEPAVVLFDAAWGYQPPRTLVLRRDAPLAWVVRQGAGDGPSAESASLDVLEKADPGFAAMVDTLLGSGCRPALPESALDDPAVAAAFLRPPRLEPVCLDSDADDVSATVATLGAGGRGYGELPGSVSRYVVVFTAPGADPLAVTGAVRASSGLAWIGNPTLLQASAEN